MFRCFVETFAIILFTLLMIGFTLFQLSKPHWRVSFHQALKNLDLTEEEISRVGESVISRWKASGVSNYEMACVYSEFKQLRRSR